MPENIFYWVLNMSILGSIAGILILCLGKIKRIPAFAIYTLWSVVLLRLLIPFGLENKYSLLNLLSGFAVKTVKLPPGNEFPQLSLTNFARAVDSYFPIVYKTELLAKVFKAAAAVWFAIGAASVIAVVVVYLFAKAEIKTSIVIKDNLYINDRIRTPMVYGVLHPKIILPAGLDLTTNTLEYILSHEKVHIRRKDNLFKVIAILTACIHWFNPLVWLFLKHFFNAMELACDAKLLKNYSDTQKKEYASALLDCAEKQSSLLFPAFGGTKIKRRIENILSYKKLTVFSCLCFTALLVSVAIILLTNAPSAV